MATDRPSLRSLALLGSLLVVPSVARASAIINGSFENGTNPPANGTFRTLPVGNTDITGWTVIQSNIDWGSQGFASDGIYALDLNGNNGAGGIEQAISTTPGTVYTILFDMNANNSTPDSVSLVAAAAGSSQSYTYSPAAMPSRPWVTESFSFIATDVTTELSFTSTTANQYFGPGLDDVRLDVPEPATLTLFGIVPLLIVLRRRVWRGLESRQGLKSR